MKATNSLRSHWPESNVRRFDKMGTSEEYRTQSVKHHVSKSWRKMLKKFQISKMRMALKNINFDKI